MTKINKKNSAYIFLKKLRNIITKPVRAQVENRFGFSKFLDSR